MSKATCLVWRGYSAAGEVVCTGNVTPFGIKGMVDASVSGTDYWFMKRLGTTDSSVRLWKERAKSAYKAVRFQKLLVNI